MYKVLLVEDEKLELDTLRNFIDWEKLGIDRVFTARGGRSALQIINQENPDILITDIQMSGLSGIELVEIIRDERHNCKVVFLTGYDKFEYAKEAIRLQVDEFLLKPFQVEEVEAVVKKLCSKIEKERQERALGKLALGRMLEQACNGQMQELESLSKFYFQKPVDQVEVNMLAFTGLSEEDQKKIQMMDEILHAFSIGQLFLTIIPGVIPGDYFRKRIFETIKEKPLQVIVCDHRVRLNELNSVYNRMIACEDDLFYEEEDVIFNVDSHIERAPYEDRIKSTIRKNLILEAILIADEKKAREFLLECLGAFLDMAKQGYRQNAFSLFLHIHRQLESMGNLDGSAAVPNILRAERCEILNNNMIQYVEQCCEACRQQQTSKWSSYVQEFVMEHYMEDCTVEEMAEGLKVSPNYLRRKFKEEAGMTILEYVTETRLKNAARLLSEGDHKVKDVSQAVGYPNISYFTQLFSRKYGVTPNEYKKKV
ncbi:MAG: response regulator [Lachnospiraceae bacterium]|nr:response regulator [Lachnospiraceae bacterium]